jgi:hypothetical protein
MIKLSTTDQHLINPCVFNFTTGKMSNVQTVARLLVQPLTIIKSGESSEAPSIPLRTVSTIIENFGNDDA